MPRSDFQYYLGQRSGPRVITEILPVTNGQRWVVWGCDCGATGKSTAQTFGYGRPCKGCGPRSDFGSFVGQRHGSRVITEILPAKTSHGPRWLVWQCDCGATGKTTAPSFRKTTQCMKCTQRGQSARATKHGGSGTPLYVSWRSIHDRCSGRKGWQSKRWYLDKGITVCDEWSTFEPFRDWALSNGYEAGLTLDRIFSCRGYSPDNCEWVTASENTRRAKQDTWRRYDTAPIELLWGNVG